MRLAASLLFILLSVPAGAAPQGEPERPATLSIRRATGPITVDGNLDDPGWRDVPPLETWYEVNPGDNTPPKVRNLGYLAYDDKFFYAAFEFDDPHPDAIRAPLGDRDNVPPYTDYGGVILDTRNTGKTAILFLANARGIQYDAVTDDSSGEDSSPDYFWDSAARITAKGWTLEMRIPFSSLRYPHTDPQTWRIILYRNYPRDFRYQHFSTRMPRGGNCLVCRSNPLEGLQGLPSGGGLVAAPYVNGSQSRTPRDGLGSPLDDRSTKATGGIDVKWRPGASTAIDATFNPDFSQIESDVAQIAVNERFALLFPEKRPFFLEGIELFATPFQAVYTRSITDPRWGVRGTGKVGSLAFTGLVAQDDGGGSVIVPGANESSFADQNFRSWVGIGRVRRDFGSSFVSALVTTREIDGGGHNVVAGPDFQWRPTTKDEVRGQILYSDSKTPVRPELAAEWDGRELSGHAGQLWWAHSTPKVDWYGMYQDVGDGFRADDGFMPQVGYRQSYGEAGYTFHPEKGLLRRLRTFAFGGRTADREGNLLLRQFSVGAGMDARWNSFVRLRYANEAVRAGDKVISRQQFVYVVTTSPSPKVASIDLEGFVGQEVDFENARPGTGANVLLRTTLRPTDHLELTFNESRRWLNVEGGTGGKGRLFTARVDRVRATYTFTSRFFVRAIGQYVETERTPSLYTSVVAAKDAAFEGSALAAYKLNWQTVLFLGYGDNRTFLEETRSLERADRQFFVKLSYAFQR
jgi:Domain of unknown function (DUF5916)